MRLFKWVLRLGLALVLIIVLALGLALLVYPPQYVYRVLVTRSNIMCHAGLRSSIST